MRCRPSGKPSFDEPAGTDMAGRPARLAGTVKTSLRYMASGSACFSPSANAALGAVGVSSTSHCLKAFFEVAGDQRAHLAGLGEIGVVEAGREHIGADDDAALHFRAEAGSAGRRIHVLQVRAVEQVAQAVAHAIIAREVRGASAGAMM